MPTQPLPNGNARNAVLVAREALIQTLKLQVEPILEAIDENNESIVSHLRELNILLGFDANANLP